MKAKKGISKRAYNLKPKIEPAGGQLGITSSSSRPDTSSMNSIFDLYSLVKQYDKNFKPGKEVNSALLNDDGTPKVSPTRAIIFPIPSKKITPPRV